MIARSLLEDLRSLNGQVGKVVVHLSTYKLMIWANRGIESNEILVEWPVTMILLHVLTTYVPTFEG